MSATRKAIRAAFKTALVGNTAAGENVYVSRAVPIWESELPAILIYSREETATIFNESPRELERKLTIAVEIAAKADENLDDTLDDIAEQVSQEMRRGEPLNQTLVGLVHDVVYTGAELILTADGDKQQHGACVMTYEVTYYTQEVAPDSELDAFETGGAEIKPVPSTPTTPAIELSVELPQI